VVAHVLIVGAGPAGASLAYLLARRGIEVSLLERQRDFAREFRGEVLNPSGLDALEQMGLGEPLGMVPTYTQRTFTAYMNGRQLFRAALEPASFRGRPPTAVSQPALLEMLVAEAAKSPHFHLERGASVKDLMVEDGRVVGVHTRTEAGEQRLRADVVVGADGRASVVRRRAGPRGGLAGPARLSRPRPPAGHLSLVGRPPPARLGDPEGHLR
jgi:2-polyprenyl-6-methoxyphenol hydroxylase-like FAD-dependent oxidoreductase